MLYVKSFRASRTGAHTCALSTREVEAGCTRNSSPEPQKGGGMEKKKLGWRCGGEKENKTTTPDAFLGLRVRHWIEAHSGHAQGLCFSTHITKIILQKQLLQGASWPTMFTSLCTPRIPQGINSRKLQLNNVLGSNE